MIETKFKQTELGLVPKAWGTPTIDELIVAMNDGPFGTKLKQEHYTTKREVRIVQLGNIGENGWNDSNVKYTTFEYAKVLSSHLVNPGDVLIAKMMPAGRSIICPNHEACFIQGSDAIKVRFNDSINTQYFIYGTKSCEYLRIIEENTQGSTRQRISLTKYRTLPFIVPPIEEQVRIAEALSDVDKLIRELDTLIEKKRSIMQGTMQELLTAHCRLPGFVHPWRNTLVEKCCKITTGESNTQDQIESGIYPFYIRSATVMRSNSYIFDCEGVITIGDGQIGKVFHYVNGKFDLHQRCYLMYDFDDVDAKFFYFLFSFFFYLNSAAF
jgi:putative modification protein of type I restriction-modification system